MNSVELARVTLKAKDYREFLRISVDFLKNHRRGFSYAHFAVRAGFSSRGFLVDVIKGSKRLTDRSVPKVARGLGLTGALKDYFATLVALEEPEVRGLKDKSAIEKKLQRLRQQLQEKTDPNQERAHKLNRILYSNRELLYVFAALGTAATGASMTEILQRTGFSVVICENILSTLVSEGLIRFFNQRYFPPTDAITFRRLGENIDFKSIYLDSLKESKAKAEMQF